MSRFIEYLNENDEYVDLLGKLEKDCSQYLSDVRRLKGGILLSGRKNKSSWFQRDIRKNRKPLDTPIEIHNMIDDVFEKKMGIRLRSNSLFCVADRLLAESYGDVFAILPMGKYASWYNEEIRDLFAYFGRHNIKKQLGIEASGGGAPKVNKELVWKLKNEYGFKDKFLNLLKSVINNYKQGFPKDNSVEIMVTGNSYYAVNFDWATFRGDIQGTVNFNDWLLGKVKIND